MSSDAPEQAHGGAPGEGERDKETVLRRQDPPFLSKLMYASYMYSIKGVLAPIWWLRDWGEHYNPPPGRPNIVKTYECRPGLPVRIFFPSSYDQSSPATLPTLFTIHGGGFCVGHIRDDDEWNRAFADKHNILVIALNYRKAPTHPFPTAPHDIEALLLALLADESLPVDRNNTRTAILGFSAGGNLALSAVQLPSIRSHPLRPAAAISVYGCLDLSVPPHEKLRNRPWKPHLPAPRGDSRDALICLAPAFDWSYIPYGHDLRDPLLSPHYAPRARLPRYVCLVGAELDMLAHESWRMACRLSREGGDADGNGNGRKREVPDRGSERVEERVCGSVDGRATAGKGELVGIPGGEGKEDERFAFEENFPGQEGGGGVKWLLVPDVVHGFDNPRVRALVGGKEAIEDAVLKTEAYTAELARWLKEVVWKV
ncbi:Alpha/Beta hydrolase protein [Achaetomium macrosporum]|uniref:Alpha/Beta hydrolase protein n=1 Tax=Achaetomium macrosporum TaxID=79813 RepID=A0AAN7CB42_9PEZI|nr:Alpha/Beta hydrolase protein [Achaetomium macrosporum]